MIQHLTNALPAELDRRRLLRGVYLVLSCVALWFIAQRGGEWYARAVYDRQMSECARNLQLLANGFRRFHHDHPEVPVNAIRMWDLYPNYVPDKAIFRCPAAQVPRDMRREVKRPKSLYSSYVWCNMAPDWPYVHRRRGDAIPILVCASHSQARVSDHTANLVRLVGPVVRMKIVQGVDVVEW